MDGVEEDHVLLARLHRDRQLDDGLDGAKADFEVGLLALLCRSQTLNSAVKQEE